MVRWLTLFWNEGITPELKIREGCQSSDIYLHAFRHVVLTNLMLGERLATYMDGRSRLAQTLN